MRNVPHHIALAGLLGVLAGGATGPAELAAAAEPQGQTIRGNLDLTVRGRPARDKRIDLTQGAVWYEPDRSRTPIESVRTEMVTTRKQFSPQLLVVPTGSRVRFPNQDPILHNVFSVSAGNTFDLGLLGSGAGKEATFRRAGIVQVFCNVHHSMFAHVVVVQTPYYGQPDESGAFVLSGLPAGSGTLWFWHERSEPASVRVLVPQRAPLALELPVTVERIPAHRNKLGRRYARGAYD